MDNKHFLVTEGIVEINIYIIDSAKIPLKIILNIVSILKSLNYIATYKYNNVTNCYQVYTDAKTNLFHFYYGYSLRSYEHVEKINIINELHKTVKIENDFTKTEENITEEEN